MTPANRSSMLYRDRGRLARLKHCLQSSREWPIHFVSLVFHDAGEGARGPSEKSTKTL